MCLSDLIITESTSAIVGIKTQTRFCSVHQENKVYKKSMRWVPTTQDR